MKTSIRVPDLDGASEVDVIEVCVAVGDEIAVEDSLLVLESEKASMDVPSPQAGKVIALHVAEGDKVSEGDLIVELEVSGGEVAITDTPPATPSTSPAAVPPPAPDTPAPVVNATQSAQVYAGPVVRKLAREFGINLSAVKGSGTHNRILKEDIQNYVKQALAGEKATSTSPLPSLPTPDFANFGEVHVEDMTKTHQATAKNMYASWINIPHVTQFDDADYTAIQAMRKDMRVEMEQRGIKITPLAFLLKACALALKEYPGFNVSLHNDGKRIYRKKYIHIGVAVDTPAGLLVPVITEVDKKDLWTLAKNVLDVATRARERKLKMKDMQGGCFTISSLGNIGGTAFTPIINPPEVAILGVSRLAVKPVYIDGAFQPREMLPLALSYDHRAVNGAEAGHFMATVTESLAHPDRLL